MTDKVGPIWIIRGVFDPVHEGHLDAMVSSFRSLSLSKLYMAVKFIGEKDPIASVEQRVAMLNLQLADSSLPIEVIVQNVKGHIDELTELSHKHLANIINVCGSDKVVRELDVYGKQGDTFWMVCRPDFPSKNHAFTKAQEKWINLVEINPDFSSSSTFVRSLLFKNELYQDGLNPEVSRYISGNQLYRMSDSLSIREKFIFGWYKFLDLLLPKFPELRLIEIQEPTYNSAQHELAWQEKYIRTVVASLKLKGDLLLRFVNEAHSL